MENQHRTYHFKGSKEDVINSILSLLFGKEVYGEASIYSNFLNESHPERYRAKIKSILDLMQKENLILLRENQPEGGIHLPNGNLPVNNNPELLPADARIYLRQHGKEVLSEGGYKKAALSKKFAKNLQEEGVPLSSKLVILLILIAAAWFII